MNLSRKLAAEFIGTAGLLAVVVGSGIMGEKLAAGNAAIALLANSVATGAGLIFLIYGFANISGAHFNPAITLTDLISGKISFSIGFGYILAQIFGAIVGVALANLMFDLPALFPSVKVRTGLSQWMSEVVATFGLVGVIRLGVRFYPLLVGGMVACYITAAYWFTSSTSFANPAVTVARSLSDTFAGIAPSSVPGFIIAQLIGALAAMFVFNWVLKEEKNDR